jgi:hypothetical protein
MFASFAIFGAVDSCRREHLEKVDRLSHYLDVDDQSVYGMRSAKLKGAYQSAFNILDKIGFS